MNHKGCLTVFGKEIKKKRIDKDMSRQELADKTGFSLSYIGGIERGERNPSLCTIIKIGKALGESDFLIRF